MIAPAVAAARDQGIDVHGPFPNDTLFYHALAGDYDAVVAMYHDQGHIALKTVGFDRAVNVTLGLPIVRTSVAHGTAFDIAGKGLADPSSLIAAVRVAARIVAGQRGSRTDELQEELRLPTPASGVASDYPLALLKLRSIAVNPTQRNARARGGPTRNPFGWTCHEHDRLHLPV